MAVVIQNGKIVFADFIKCKVCRNEVFRVVWLPPWEVKIDIEVELREEDQIETWKIVSILDPYKEDE